MSMDIAIRKIGDKFEKMQKRVKKVKKYLWKGLTSEEKVCIIRKSQAERGAKQSVIENWTTEIFETLKSVRESR